MRTFDINTAIGHWPFRKVPNQSAPELRALLSRHGIAGAAVANTHGLFYKNCHDANLELAEAIAGHRDFYVGVATLNPLYAAWERDLHTCADDLGLKALRMAPQYHDYRLDSDEAIGLARAATGMGLPILVPCRVVDIRQRHWRDAERTVDLEEIFALCEAVPEARVVCTECVLDAGLVTDQGGDARFPGFYVEMSRIASAQFQYVAGLSHALGADHVLFGSGAPFKSVTPALLKLENADLTDAEKELIAGKNALSLLGVE